MKRFRNAICLILGILSSYSLLFEVTSKGIKFSRSNTMMLTYLIDAIFLFVFYKKYLGNFKGKKTYRIIALVFSLLMVFGYSYDVAGDSSLVFGSISLAFISLLKTIGYYALFSTAFHIFNDIIV